MGFSDIVSTIAIVLSTTAFLITYFRDRKLSEENRRFQGANAYLQRNAELLKIGALAETPSILEFYGLDLDEIKNAEISIEDIHFLVLSVYSMKAYCMAEGTRVSDYLKNSKRREIMFSLKKTQKVWKYAQHFFISTAEDINNYLRETYPEEYGNPD